MNYQQWLQQATQALNQANSSENGRIDALALLQSVTQKSRAFILAFGETALEKKTLEKLTALLSRRLKGEPIAYLLGGKEFWSLPLAVSEKTLIPRPDTEILVEKAVEIAIEKLQKCDQHLPCFRILDLGTGTGAIALALASELKSVTQKQQIQLDIIGVDFLPEIVELARTNAEKNQLNVHFVQSHWFDNVTGKFDLIVSNPPYIDSNDEHLQQGDVRFEPLSALVAEESGYADLRHIIEQAPQYLTENGYLLLEHGWQQGEKVRSIFQMNLWQNVDTCRDYGNNERVTLGRWANISDK